MKCPGPGTRSWKPEDIFSVPCPACNKPVEFFKDENCRRCPSCGYWSRNPRLDLDCPENCPYAEQCLGEVTSSLPNEDT